jgi:hypothetical protein
MDIVLGRRIWPTTIDEKALRGIWEELDKKANAAVAAFAEAGPVERALDSVLRDARNFGA